MNIQTALREAVKKLAKSISAYLDAETVLAFVLKKNRARVLANSDYQIPQARQKLFKKLINRRAAGEPVAYLIGHKEFFGLDFKVTRGVLIPRPETETLVERALLATHYPLPTTIIDIGTGSGCIIISLAKSLPNKKIKFIAIDSSAEALDVARVNARKHGVYKKIKFLHGNLLPSPIPKPKNYKLPPSTLMLANLPYLTPRQYRANPDLHFEPKQALVAGRDGLKYYRRLFSQLKKFELQKTTLILEHDPHQKLTLQKLAKKSFPKATLKFDKDLAYRDRVLEIAI